MSRRSPRCVIEEGLQKGVWTAMEDKRLIEYVEAHGEGKWPRVAKSSGLKRCGKSCRLRWMNYLKPGIKRGNITPDEEDLIIRLHKLLGNRWSLIAGRLPDRSDNEIKNYWNTTLSKKLVSSNIIVTLPLPQLAPSALTANNCSSNQDYSTNDGSLQTFDNDVDFNITHLLNFSEFDNVDVTAGCIETYQNSNIAEAKANNNSNEQHNKNPCLLPEFNLVFPNENQDPN
ncbi:unnamed protein product [Rhodiola kirilowii]